MDTNIITESSIEQRVKEICKTIRLTGQWTVEYLGCYYSLMGFVLKYNNKEVTYLYHTDNMETLKSRIIDRMRERDMGKITCKLKKI